MLTYVDQEADIDDDDDDQGGEDDPTGLDDLEELERQIDAESSTVNQTAVAGPSTQAGTSNQPATTSRATGHTRGRGFHALPWTDVQDIQVLRIYARTEYTTWQQRVDAFNEHFPDHPPRSSEAYRQRYRILTNRSDTIASIQAKINAAYVKDAGMDR